MKDSIPGDKYAKIRIFGFVFFLAASAFCVYKIYELNSSSSGGSGESANHFATYYSTKLKLVSVFQRHGDRGPSDFIPNGDKHHDAAKELWPNGASNLTQTGVMRQFRIGLELRNRYERFLDYNASQFLAFSSPFYRCQQSLAETLRGLFDIELTVPRGRKLAERYNLEQGNGNKFCFREDDLVHNETYCSQQKSASSRLSQEREQLEKNAVSLLTGLPGGSGLPLEYKKIKIDLTTVPSLTYHYLTNCKWRKDNPTPVDPNLFNSKAIAQLKGVNKLAKLLKARYDLDFNFTAFGLWSTISNELLLARTKESIGYSDHYLDWINTPLPEYSKTGLSLYDLWEQAAVLGYRDRIAGTANLIQFGPMVTSLVTSQSAALSPQPQGRPVRSIISSTISANSHKRHLQPAASAQLGADESAAPTAATYADGELYRGKKMIIYGTHDTIVQQLMMNLSLVKFEPDDYEKRFLKWGRADDHTQMLHGLRMARFGLSLVFELYETELRSQKGRPVDAAQHGGLAMGAAAPASKKFPFVQALLYNQADIKLKPVQYRRLEFGAACRAMFWAMNRALPRARVDSMLDQFYSADFPLDKDLSCPFELFKHVTSSYMLQPAELTKLCAN